jgi:formylglycine-generating enzyme required for sulfatase activity
LQTTEVTQGQWVEIMGENPSEFKKCGDDCPVENVSWDDCQEFIRKLNERESTYKYRLPTEAEWEFACRAGKGAAFANGGISESGCGLDSNLDQMGWYCANSRRKTHPVAGKKNNAYGLYDMHGNVWEWCHDWYGKYPKGAVVDPKGARYGPKRVIRGGSCLNYVEKCRSAYRYSYKANVKMNNIGLRLARTK